MGVGKGMVVVVGGSCGGVCGNCAGGLVTVVVVVRW